ncbi:hypothetical protein SAMN05192551_10344 [Tindallia magadiensis]|uniref:Uncharacterized protein n=1 Tax=Tindallia magadiensis TaxID=69895 RepID=A0A1I3CWQ4_9FIRM|nr:hypothetical protein [Tindallia magadiensis]SFH78661.1 hypothetical protein SAMN05192551_10344 [Tindallia magadiensis]
MIKHTVSTPKKSFSSTLLIVIGLVVAVNFSVHVINRLPGSYGGLGGLLLILALAIYTSRLMNRKLASYIYEWDGEKLRISKKIGRRDKMVLELPKENIQWIRPLEEIRSQLPQMKRPRKTMALSCRLQGDAIYLLQYVDGKRTYRVIFEPGAKLQKELKKAAKEKVV